MPQFRVRVRTLDGHSIEGVTKEMGEVDAYQLNKLNASSLSRDAIGICLETEYGYTAVPVANVSAVQVVRIGPTGQNALR